MEYLCQGMKHYAWGTEARLQDPDGNEGFLKITNEQKVGGFEMPMEHEPFDYEGELCADSTPHAPAPETAQEDPPEPEWEGDVQPGGGDGTLKGFDPAE